MAAAEATAEASPPSSRRSTTPPRRSTTCGSFARLGYAHGIEFVAGFFEQTLPGLAGGERRWSVIRLDGDTYDVTLLALRCLYPSLSNGGYLIIDDYLDIDECRQAVDDFRREHSIDEPLEQVDWACARWRRTSERRLSRTWRPPGRLLGRARRCTPGPSPRAHRARPPTQRPRRLIGVATAADSFQAAGPPYTPTACCGKPLLLRPVTTGPRRCTCPSTSPSRGSSGSVRAPGCSWPVRASARESGSSRWSYSSMVCHNH